VVFGRMEVERKKKERRMKLREKGSEREWNGWS
jgi:hypothetical protein